MSKRPIRRMLAVLLAFAMLAGFPGTVLAADSDSRTPMTIERVSDDLVPAAQQNDADRLAEPTPADPNEIVRVSIVMEKPSTIEAGFSTQNIAANASAMAYREGLREEQATIESTIEREVLNGQALDVVWNLTLAANIISANVRRGDMEKIAAVKGVADVFEETQYSPDVVSVGGEADPNMAISGQMTGTQNAWNLGYTGAGTKIAIVDTGLDIDHQSFDAAAFNHSLGLQGFDFGKLMDAADIAEVFDELNIAPLVDDPSVLYRNTKVPYAFNYVDENLDITHMNDSQGEHGSHVAGIAAANAYVDTDDDGTFEKAIDTVMVAGNAPDAQLMIMKVFGTGGGAYDSDYMVAIEDAVILGADSVNLSLGSGNPGPSREASYAYQDILDDLVESGTVVTMSAGNAGAWAENSTPGNLYSDGVSFDMVGSPGSYTNSLAVASVDNDGMISPTLEVEGHKYGYSETLSANGPIAALDTAEKNTYDFVFINNYGHSVEEYTKADVKDKIVFVWRGDGVDFSNKHLWAQEAGAIALVVVNNQPGTINMQLGTAQIPAVSITLADGQEIWKNITGTDVEIGKGDTAKGTITIHSNMEVMPYNSSYYTMSSFSSWGVPGSLELKPEISAPGGSIYSVWGASQGLQEAHNAYELMSGTSMASPQVTGISALVQGYIRQKGYDEGITSRALTQALLMGTATPMRDENGDYYSLLQQGSGLVNANGAVTTPAYITVKGQDDGKVKAELGDDPDKTGTYTVELTVHNLTGNTLYYAFDGEVFTQDSDGTYLYGNTTPIEGANIVFYAGGEELKGEAVSLDWDFDGDKNVSRADAQLLLDHVVKGTTLPYHSDKADVDGDNDVDTHDVTALLSKGVAYAEVPAYGSVDVTAVISGVKLDETNYPVGGYVEAFINAAPKCTPEGVIYPELSVPVLGYYGNWTDSSMFDMGSAEEWYTGEFKDGRDPYLLDAQDSYMTNYVTDGNSWIGEGGGFNSTLVAYVCTPIRNAGNGIFKITWVKPDGETGVWMSKDLGPVDATYYYTSAYGGFWQTTHPNVPLNWAPVDENNEQLPDGTEVSVSLILAPEYYAGEDGTYDWEALTDGDSENGELGKGAYLTTNLVVDFKAPEIQKAEEQTGEDNVRHILVEAKDNTGLARVSLYSSEGKLAYEYSGDYYGSDGSSTAPNTGADEVFTADFDGFYSVNEIYQMFLGLNLWNSEPDDPLTDDVYLVQVEDKAGNLATYRVFAGVEETETAESITLSAQSAEIVLGSTYQLTAKVRPAYVKDDSVTWSSSNEDVATVSDTGLVTTVGKGDTTITATTKAMGENGEPLTATCAIKVYTIDVTATGVLADEDGNPFAFEWDFETGKFTETHSVDQYPTGVGNVDDESYYLFNTTGNMYLMDKATGEAKEGPWAWDVENSPNPWSMNYSKEGLNWTYGYYVMVADDPEAPTYMGFNFSGLNYPSPYFYGVAAVDEHWEYELDGEDYEGEWTVYAIDDSNNVLEMLMFKSGDDWSCLRGMSPSDLPVAVEGYTDSSTGNFQSYSSLVVGDDGALYYSMMTGNTNEIYRLVYNEDADMWQSTKMGDFGAEVWPGMFLEVTSNHPESASGSNAFKNMEKIDAVELEPMAMKAEVESAAASESVTGSLNKVDTGEGTTPEAKSGITADRENHTVTIPICADSTNALLNLNYDSSVLTLANVRPAGALVSYTDSKTSEDETNSTRTLKLGFAASNAVNGAAAEVVFNYVGANGSTTVTMQVSEDGDEHIDTPETQSFTVSLPVNVPPVPSTPSQPSGDTQKPDTGTTVPEFPFADVEVSEDNWYYDAVKSLYEAGLIHGMTEDSFEPNTAFGRAQLAEMLYNLEGAPEVEITSEYSDVSADQWFAKSVSWASANGVVNGADGMFRPDDPISREELAVMLYRYAKLKGVDVESDLVALDVSDADSVSDWASEAVTWTFSRGLMKGRDDGSWGPHDGATRAEAATVIYRYMTLIGESN